MILNGPKLLLFPSRSRQTLQTPLGGRASWLIVAALTASVWPALAVVAGHMGSIFCGHDEPGMASLRAIVGLIAVVGGSLVTVPAMTLLVLTITDAARERSDVGNAGLVTMGIVWPVWTTGVLLVVPPILGLGPELGEWLWLILATGVAVRFIRTEAISRLGIRRRWAGRFQGQMIAAFVLLFSLVVIAPPLAVRSLLGAATPILPSVPKQADLPRPPSPNW